MTTGSRADIAKAPARVRTAHVETHVTVEEAYVVSAPERKTSPDVVIRSLNVCLCCCCFFFFIVTVALAVAFPVAYLNRQS